MSQSNSNKNFNIKNIFMIIAMFIIMIMNVYSILLNSPSFNKLVLSIDIFIILIPIVFQNIILYLRSNYYITKNKIELKNQMLTTPYKYNQLNKIRNEYITQMEHILTRKHTYRDKKTLNLKLHKFDMDELFIHYYYLNFVLPNIFTDNIYYDNDIYKTYDRVHKYIKDNNKTEDFNKKREEFGNRKIRTKDIKSILS